MTVVVQLTRVSLCMYFSLNDNNNYCFVWSAHEILLLCHGGHARGLDATHETQSFAFVIITVTLSIDCTLTLKSSPQDRSCQWIRYMIVFTRFGFSLRLRTNGHWFIPNTKRLPTSTVAPATEQHRSSFLCCPISCSSSLLWQVFYWVSSSPVLYCMNLYL